MGFKFIWIKSWAKKKLRPNSSFQNLTFFLRGRPAAGEKKKKSRREKKKKKNEQRWFVGEFSEWEGFECHLGLNVPAFCEADLVLEGIIRLLHSDLKVGGNFTIEAVVGKFSDDRIPLVRRDELEQRGVRFTSMNSEQKQVADAEIIRRMKKWADLHSNGVLILMTSDGDFASTIHEIRNRHPKITTVLIYLRDSLRSQLNNYPVDGNFHWYDVLFGETCDNLGRPPPTGKFGMMPVEEGIWIPVVKQVGETVATVGTRPVVSGINTIVWADGAGPRRTGSSGGRRTVWKPVMQQSAVRGLVRAESQQAAGPKRAQFWLQKGGAGRGGGTGFLPGGTGFLPGGTGFLPGGTGFLPGGTGSQDLITGGGRTVGGPVMQQSPLRGSVRAGSQQAAGPKRAQPKRAQIWVPKGGAGRGGS